MSYAETIEQLLRSSRLSDVLDDPSLRSIPLIMRLQGGQDVPAYKAKSLHDVQRWQFWPRYVAMGNLIGNVFNQVSPFVRLVLT